MASHRGRHRRPSKAGKVIGTAATGCTAAGIIVIGSTSAQAQPLAHASLDTFYPVEAAVSQVQAKESPRTVTVGSGDYLSKISQEDCGTPQDWTGIYDKNVKVIGKNPDLIIAGQKLIISCKTGWAPKPPVVAVEAAAVTSQYHGSYSASAVETVSTTGDGSFQACVIRAESGGNSQVMNSTGHYGLYQFSSSTWAAHGGNPADFGHASVSEQNQIFENTYREDGTSDWQPYDGCS